MIHQFIDFLKIIGKQQYLIMSLAKRQVRSQFVGSFLGFFWTFLNPIVMIGILWFVFSVGFKARPNGDIPFVVWLTAGMAIWQAFSDIVNGSLSVLIENQNLIKKTLVQAQILPLAKILAALITHLVFLMILFVLIIIYRLPMDLFFLQFLYYFFSMSVLALGLGWLVSAINIFVRDTTQVVALVLQLLFWVTPIMWDISIMPAEWHRYLKLNPIFYLTQGYRDSFFYFTPFWKDWGMTLYYWGVAALFFIVGGLVFKKAKPHFADVL